MYEYLLIYHSHIFTLRKKHNYCVLCVKKFVYVRFVLILGKIMTAIAMVFFLNKKENAKNAYKIHTRNCKRANERFMTFNYFWMFQRKN